MVQELYDTMIIGEGPAGAGAAVYTARKRLQTLVITAGCDDPDKQNNISAGDGVRAAASAYHDILDI
jgi:flavin-dependent dehydrogenase